MLYNGNYLIDTSAQWLLLVCQSFRYESVYHTDKRGSWSTIRAIQGKIMWLDLMITFWKIEKYWDNHLSTYLDIQLIDVLKEALDALFTFSSMQQHEFNISRRQER